MGSSPTPGFAPRAFFEVLLPALLLERESAAREVAAVVQLHLMGAVDCAWYLDLTESGVAVIEGLCPDADLHIAVDESLVLPLLAGQLRVGEALQRGTLQVDGDLGALERLIGLFKMITGVEARRVGMRR